MVLALVSGKFWLISFDEKFLGLILTPDKVTFELLISCILIKWTSKLTVVLALASNNVVAKEISLLIAFEDEVVSFLLI